MLVDVPCKIGDEVWAIRNYRGARQAKKGIVTEMQFVQWPGMDDMRLLIVVCYVGRGFWGERVFGSYDEALAALKGE